MEQKRNYHEPCACQKPAPVPCDKPKCDNCRGSKGNCFCLPPKVIPVEVDGCPILFRKVIIPVSVGDETTYPPVNGLYRNVLLEYESSGSLYLYSSDGIPTHIVNDLEQITKLIRELVEAEAQTRAEADDHLQDNIDSAVTTLSRAIGEETSAREGADRILDGKIEAETTARGLADQTLDGKITDEKTNREDADRLLWAEINLLEIASDVVDIVGTYAALQAYDTSKLQDNDIVKVLKDETHNNATTYYRWNKTTSQFAYIGEEGPYYTTSQTDTLLAGKQDTLTAGSNIQISNNTISATDTTYTAGAGLSLTGTEFAVDTTVIAEKNDIPTVNDATLTVTQNGTSVGIFTANASSDVTIALTDTTYSAFTGTDGTAAGTAGLVPAPTTTDAGKFLKADGTWSTAGGAANNINSTDWNALWQ